VPFSVYDELMEAPSKGTYFNDFIRDLYAYKHKPADATHPPQYEATDEFDVVDLSD
jgi:KTSC domain